MLPSSDSASSTSIVGRERESRSLRQYLDRSLDGHGSLVLVSGEAGIGKTTLIRNLAEQAADIGCLVLAGGCYDVTTTPPYGPWSEIISRYPLDDELPPIPNQLRAAGGMTGIDSQAALFELAGRFLALLAARRPLVLQLEDLHWADQASLDLLRYLSRTLAGAPILCLATYRDDDVVRGHPLPAMLQTLVREGHVQRLQLQRLDRHAVRTLVLQRYRLASADEDRLVDYLMRLAAGNPFFTNELLLTLDAQRLLRPAAGGWVLGDLSQTGVPALVQQVIDGRLSRLKPVTRDLLECAAVIGFEAPLDLIRQLNKGPISGLDDAFQEAQERHLFLTQPGHPSIHFQHALVRQAIYAASPPLRRQSLHRRLAESLSDRQGVDPEIVADHFYAAGDERALEWLVRMAERAASVFAPQSVTTACDRALNLADGIGIPAPLIVYRLRGQARASTGDFDGALSDHEQLLVLARRSNNRYAEWQALMDLGALWASRNYERTRDYCQQAVDLAREMDDASALGHSLNRLGNWQVNAEQPVDALRHHNEALDIFETTADPEGLASTLDLRAATHLLSGNFYQASRDYGRAIPLLRLLDDRQTLSSSLNNAAMSLWGDLGYRAIRHGIVPASLAIDTGQLVADSLEIAREIEWRAGESHASTSVGILAVARGSLRVGIRQLLDGLAIARQIQHRQWTIVAHFRLGAACTELLLREQAREHLEQGAQIATASVSSFFETSVAGALASLYVQMGDYEQAERLIRGRVEIDRPPDMISSRVCWFAASELALAQCRLQAAMTLVDTLIESIPPGPGDLSPHLARLRGEILLACGRLDEAELQLAGARDTAERLDFPLISWRILATQRRLHLAQDRVDEANRIGDTAREIVSDLANELDDERLRTIFVTHAHELLSDPSEPSSESHPVLGDSGLTVREVEVLRYVATGMTDIEVSDRLFISPRTVSQHLRSIYSKLDVNNRTAAVHIAVERDLI